jgi:lipopolysaccharide export system permease protein
MILFSTLGRYIAGRFLRGILTAYLFFFAIVYLGDFLELFRRSTERQGFTPAMAALASLMRVPSIVELMLPFAVLAGSIWAFLSLSRRLELVVARAAGISVWQFTAPALAVALVLGLVTTSVYNPIGTYFRSRADELTANMFYRETRFTSDGANSQAWLAQDGPDGESIMHAKQSLEQGEHLINVTVMTFDAKGRFRERIEAAEARYSEKLWTLTNGVINAPKSAPKTFETYTIATYLSLDQIRNTLAEPESVPFWKLKSYIDAAQNAGLPAYAYDLQYQLLLARPLLFAAMVLIAATVSLRVFRFGNIGRLILGGAVAGFVLYVVGELARGLGSVGIVPPALAAWSPAVVATLFGFTVLLYQEDG